MASKFPRGSTIDSHSNRKNHLAMVVTTYDNRNITIIVIIQFLQLDLNVPWLFLVH